MRVIAVLPSIYLAFACVASGQILDPTTQIANQADNDVAEALTSHARVEIVPSAPSNNPSTEAAGGQFGEYSGYRNSSMPVPTKLFTFNYFINQETYNEKNSFLGTGVTNTFLNQLGCDITTPYGTDIQPFISYQYASTHLFGTTSSRGNTYGAALNLSQKIFPFFPLFGSSFAESQPNAVFNLGNATPEQIAAINSGDHDVHNIYPNFDTKLGLSLGAADANLGKFKGHWSYVTQDIYSIAPNMAFDFYFRPATVENRLSLLPNAVSIIPTYSHQLTSANDGTSGSSGILSIQDRNTYIWALDAKSDSDKTVDESIQVVESNTLLHDTDQEPLVLSPTPASYQNWAKFGLAVQYVNPAVSVKVEYTYEAFNAQYASQNVVATLNIAF
jgi:hypothetical protein